MDIDNQQISQNPKSSSVEEFELHELVSKRKQDEIAPMEKRFLCVSVRLNSDELLVLNKYRGRTRKGEALRMLAFTNLPQPIPTINAKAWQELSKASACLNQLTHRSNSGESVEIEELRTQLEAFRAALVGAQI